MKNKYRIKEKNKLWQVTLETGSHSDYTIQCHVFLGNSVKEVWEMFKIWIVLEPLESWEPKAFCWKESNRKFFSGDKKDVGDIAWDSEFSFFLVKINRLEVIQVTQNKLLKDYKS